MKQMKQMKQMSSFSNFPKKLELTVSRLEGGNLAEIAILTKLGCDTENIFTAATGMLAEDYPPGTADVIAESRVMTIPCCKCKVQIQTTCYFHLLPTGQSGNIGADFPLWGNPAEEAGISCRQCKLKPQVFGE
jgi:hypothetical protein